MAPSLLLPAPKTIKPDVEDEEDERETLGLFQEIVLNVNESKLMILAVSPPKIPILPIDEAAGEVSDIDQFEEMDDHELLVILNTLTDVQKVPSSVLVPPPKTIKLELLIIEKEAIS